MMKILIITSQHEINKQDNLSLLHLFGAAAKLFAVDNSYDDKCCDVAVIGRNLEEIATAIASYAIVNTVFAIEYQSDQHVMAEDVASTIANLFKDYTHVLVAASSFGKNLLPRIAGILECSQVSEIVDITAPNRFKKFIYTGNVLVEIESNCQIKLLTVRTGNFDPEQQQKSTHAPIIAIPIAFNNHQSRFISNEVIDTIDLSNAKMVVSGGISLNSRENFDKLIRTLATTLNAGVGATRDAVEAGLAHNDCQIGQTGKVVSPELYLAIGISGAPQHIAGMKDAKTVIAINNDVNAPIFNYADYGLVTDLFVAVPELIAKI